MIQIANNDYTQPTEVREFVVQGIIDAFLSDNLYNMFVPYPSGPYRDSTLYICKHKYANKYYGFRRTPTKDMEEREDFVRIRGCEMKESFKIILKAGYYIFRVNNFPEQIGYIVSKTPHINYYNNPIMVKEFNEFID